MRRLSPGVIIPAPTISKNPSGSPPVLRQRELGTLSRVRGWGQRSISPMTEAAYTISDRGTYLAFLKRLTLPILVQGDRRLLNFYSVIEVNPANGPKINTAGGKAFADFMVAPSTQSVIKNFDVKKFGQPLFVPVWRSLYPLD